YISNDKEASTKCEKVRFEIVHNHYHLLDGGDNAPGEFEDDDVLISNREDVALLNSELDGRDGGHHQLAIDADYSYGGFSCTRKRYRGFSHVRKCEKTSERFGFPMIEDWISNLVWRV
ncbi:LOW QUALITY PROTEIN: hypothetical protein TorRG33x02_022310, partial [Trema orientale]